MCEKCERMKKELLSGEGLKGFDILQVSVDLEAGVIDFGNTPESHKLMVIAQILKHIMLELPGHAKLKGLKAIKPHLPKDLIAAILKDMTASIQKELNKDGWGVIDMDDPEGVFAKEIEDHFKPSCEIYMHSSNNEMLIFSTAKGKRDFLERSYEKESLLVKALGEMRTLRLLVESGSEESVLN